MAVSFTVGVVCVFVFEIESVVVGVFVLLFVYWRCGSIRIIGGVSHGGGTLRLVVHNGCPQLQSRIPRWLPPGWFTGFIVPHRCE